MLPRLPRELVLLVLLLALVGGAELVRASAAGGALPFVGMLRDVVIRALPTLLVAIGMALVVGLGGIDLSVGSAMAFTAAVAASAVASGTPFLLAVPLALGIGAGLGVANGSLVRGLAIQPLVATLVAMVAVRGGAQLVSGGQILEVQDEQWLAFGTTAILELPIPFWVTLGVFGSVAVLLSATRVGAALACLGDNPRAARLLGLRVSRAVILTYALSGSLAALAGLIETASNHAADADKCGLAIELDAILAVVIGGTPLRGGRVRLVATVLGVLLVEALATAMATGNVRRELALCAKAALVLVIAALVGTKAR